ncbi:MAG: hypothetical protein JXK05_09560 [Campylobacterales bacterium]|nr:hypothetical protein [Campylobacterales bacterium]
MFGMQLNDLQALIKMSKDQVVRIARKIQRDLDIIDEISASMLLLALLRLNYALHEFRSRLYLWFWV